MLAFRFCSSVSRWRRVLSALRSSSCPFDAFVGFVLSALSLPVLCVFWVVRARCFVRFPRPALRPWGAPSRVVCPSAGWVCVSSSSLPALFRSGRWVWSVRPAVVCRRSGVVLFFWVWVSPSAVRPAPWVPPFGWWD